MIIQPKLIIYFSYFSVTAEAIFCQSLYKRGWNGDGNKSLRGRVGWNGYSAGMDRDGSETRWRWVGTDLKSVGTGGDGYNFCSHAGLYYIPCNAYGSFVYGQGDHSPVNVKFPEISRTFCGTPFTHATLTDPQPKPRFHLLHQLYSHYCKCALYKHIQNDVVS